MEQSNQIAQLIVSGITSGCIYAVVAIGFSVIYNSTQVINFAQGEFVMLGAMVAAALMPGFGLIVAIPVAILAGCAAGLVVAMFVVVPQKLATPVSLVVMTVGASILFRGLAQLFFGESAIPVRPFTSVDISGYAQDRMFHIAGAAIRAQSLWVMAITVVMVVGLALFFRYTMVGKAMRACASNSVGSRLVGINVRRMIVVSFVLAAAMGAAAGVAVGPIFFARFNMGAPLGLKGFCAAVLGGLGNIPGAIVGGVLLGVAESLAGGLLWSDYREAIAFVILVLVLFIRPQGILSNQRARK